MKIKSGTVEEKEQMNLLQDQTRNLLRNYIDFLITKERTHISILSRDILLYIKIIFYIFFRIFFYNTYYNIFLYFIIKKIFICIFRLFFIVFLLLLL